MVTVAGNDLKLVKKIFISVLQQRIDPGMVTIAVSVFHTQKMPFKGRKVWEGMAKGMG